MTTPAPNPSDTAPGAGSRGAIPFAVGLGLIIVAVIVCIEALRSPAQSGEMLAGADAAYPRTVATADGDVVIPAKPQRILSMTLGADEILLAMCPHDRLVGLTKLSTNPAYSNVVEQSVQLQRVCVGAEAIIAQNPDLVFMASYNSPELVEQVRSTTKATIIRFSEFDSVADIQRNIRAIGHAIGEDAAAKALCDEIDQRVARAIARVPLGSTPPTTLSVSMAGHTSGSGTLYDDIITKLGARNLAAEHGVEWFGQVNREQIALWDPEVLIAGAEPGMVDDMRQSLLDDPVYGATRAAETGRIYVIGYPAYSTVSHNVSLTVEALAECLWPHKR